MDTNTLLLVILAVVVIAVIVVVSLIGSRKRQSADLREKFGPEYENTLQQFNGDKSRAEQELAAREKRVDKFDIHPLEPQQRNYFENEWRTIQTQFVDAPDQAVARADSLIQQVMQAEGYPVGDFEQRAADISVDHPGVVTHYRAAHETALKNDKSKANTEELRQALVHYRALFQDLLSGETVQAVKEAV